MLVVPPVAYLVLVFVKQGERAEVCMARLSRRSVRRVLYSGLGFWKKHRKGLHAALLTASVISGGGCSGHAGCVCVRSGELCATCVEQGGFEQTWVARNGFCGVFPCPDRPWFTGVTDAADIPHVRRDTRAKWLCCREE
jgi:hypothetical protein